ncbi:CofD-like superfamily protein [Skeletonema marinoi]|uniref:CofD-like superfamily protein n=1 Tax=Skeletonema marinoi TaxID=267567 RepID=A0AAD9D6W1_9STRA|nr:CofD-like superfamily protein [Skeletonema marinoi]
MTFIAIRNLVLVLIILTFVNSTTLSAATETTASFVSSSAVSTIQTKSSSAMNMEKDELYIESMEPVKFNDSKQQQTPTRKRGRPGIVVFSGGTAFNAAAAEMALRNVASVAATSSSSRVVASNNDAGVGVAGGLDDDSIKSENSIHEMMMMTSMMMSQSNTNNNNNNIMEGGGIKVWHVLPVTDDGGSTAEIVRVLGGPAVGDIRSRLLRLAPGHTREGRAVRRLLGHRLVSLETIKKQQQRRRRKNEEEEEEEEITTDKVSRMAREEWFDIIDGGMESHRHHGLRHYADEEEEEEDNDDESDSDDYEHPLWKGVSTPYRSIIRSFLVHFHSQVMHTHNGIRHSSRNPPFDFQGGSVGNFFFAGARTFFGSLPAAIFLFSKVAGIPSGSRVLPAVLSEERLVLGAVLKDGTRLRGQYEISHPSPRQLAMKSDSTKEKDGQRDRSGSFKVVVKSFDTSESLNEGITSLHPSAMKRVCYLLHDPTWRRKVDGQRNANNLSAAAEPPSHQRSKSRVRTDWTDRHEVDPEPNPSVLEAISNANCIVYGCGSLFTSVLPSLVLRGVGEEIVRKAVPRVLLLNGWHDHETTWMETSSDGNAVVKQMDATAIVQTIASAFDRGNEQCKDDEDDSHDGCSIDIKEQSLEELCASRQRLRSEHAASVGMLNKRTNCLRTWTVLK